MDIESKEDIQNEEDKAIFYDEILRIIEEEKLLAEERSRFENNIYDGIRGFFRKIFDSRIEGKELTNIYQLNHLKKINDEIGFKLEYFTDSFYQEYLFAPNQILDDYNKVLNSLYHIARFIEMAAKYKSIKFSELYEQYKESVHIYKDINILAYIKNPRVKEVCIKLIKKIEKKEKISNDITKLTKKIDYTANDLKNIKISISTLKKYRKLLKDISEFSFDETEKKSKTK